MIILKGKDCSDKIMSIALLPDGRYEVYFNGDKRKFVYLSSNVKILHKKQTLDANKYLTLVNGEIQNGVMQIDDYGSFYKLIYKTGFERAVDSNLLKLIRSCLDDEKSKEKFDYFKSIANEISLYTEDGKNILGSYYEKIKFIRDDTVLNDYFNGVISEDHHHNPHQNIFPFGFNKSQKRATENAMTHKLSIIQGPPGTGKTQTILNIIANIIRDGKTVAVVSNNNSAIDNIYEKLQSGGIDFIAAKLGSIKNKQGFLLNQFVPTPETLREWEIKNYNEYGINNEIKSLESEIESTLQQTNRLAVLKDKLESITIEASYFFNYYENTYTDVRVPNFSKSPNPELLLDLWNKLDRNKNNISFLNKLWSWFFCHIKIDNFYNQPISILIAALQKSYYDARIKDLGKSIDSIQVYISNNDLDEKIKRHVDLSMDIFRSHIAKRYLKKLKKTNYTIGDLWRNSKNFIEDYPVVLSTTYSLRNSLSNDYVYDYVIIDEASQVDLATFVLALSCAKNAVIVGDEKQLPNVINDETKRKDSEIFSQFSIPDQYMFSNHSALSTITELFGDKVPNQLLREHYRCNPKIIGFCNKMFYDNQLIILTPETKDSCDPLKLYETVKGNHARDDHINQRQIDVTLNEVVPRENLNLLDGSVGIVTPYKNQAKALNDALIGKNVLAATVDKFQGRERDVMIINTVDNNISDFASSPNRLNVAVSRAKKQLIVVTNGNENSSHTGIDELVNYIKYNNYETVNSDVRSIFDNLYKDYYKRNIQKARKNSSPAEDLMMQLIKEIYVENNFVNLDTQLEYPLKMLINASNLIGREYEYASNEWVRVDFVIFSKTSKQPVLAIEVDGYAFHKSIIQQERDAIKTKLLQNTGVPLIRFSTIGSNEKTLLAIKLRELMRAYT
jgi:superfamily I DNA and/or RNA helicase/very-short-patch-repair endonuclease